MLSTKTAAEINQSINQTRQFLTRRNTAKPLQKQRVSLVSSLPSATRAAAQVIDLESNSVGAGL